MHHHLPANTADTPGDADDPGAAVRVIALPERCRLGFVPLKGAKEKGPVARGLFVSSEGAAYARASVGATARCLLRRGFVG